MRYVFHKLYGEYATNVLVARTFYTFFPFWLTEFVCGKIFLRLCLSLAPPQISPTRSDAICKRMCLCCWVVGISVFVSEWTTHLYIDVKSTNKQKKREKRMKEKKKKTKRQRNKYFSPDA